MSTTTHDALAAALHRVAPDVDLDEIADDDLLVEAAELDSMDFLNLLNALHELTGVDVPERDYPRLTTVADIETYLDARRRGTSGPGGTMTGG